MMISITSRVDIENALHRMNLTLVREKKEVHAHDGVTTDVDMYLREHPGIGFKREKTGYKVHGDFWRNPLVSVEKFTADIVQNHGVVLATRMCEEVGHQVVNVSNVGEDVHIKVMEG